MSQAVPALVRSALAAFCLLASPFTQAVVLHDSPLDAAAGFGWNSNAGTQVIAESFTIAADADLDSVTFYGFFQAPSQTGAFDILLFDDASGLPAATPFYSTTTASQAGVDTLEDNPSGRDIHRWTFAVPSVSLLGGSNYWISIQTVEPAVWTWSHGVSDGSGDVTGIFIGETTFRSDPSAADRQAFRLEGALALPEPAPLALLALALLGLALLAPALRRGHARA